MKPKHVPLLIPSWEGLEIKAQNEASQAARTFASQPNRQAQNAFILDAHRAVTYFPRGFVMSWEHSSWSNQ